MANKLYAIWEYDSPPYYLGGEVVELKKDGYVTVQGYSGMQFKYFKLYPYSEGLSKIEQINVAGNEYEKQRKQLHTSLREKLDKILK